MLSVAQDYLASNGRMVYEKIGKDLEKKQL
jgi:hypothetical protein